MKEKLTKEQRQFISYKQLRTPRKVKPTYGGFFGCATCGSTVDRECSNYCPNCGQALDWTDWCLDDRYQEGFSDHILHKIDSLLRYYEQHNELNAKHKKTLKEMAKYRLLDRLDSTDELGYYYRRVKSSIRVYFTMTTDEVDERTYEYKTKVIYWCNL